MLNLNGTATVDLGPKISMDFTPLSNEHGWAYALQIWNLPKPY